MKQEFHSSAGKDRFQCRNTTKLRPKKKYDIGPYLGGGGPKKFQDCYEVMHPPRPPTHQALQPNMARSVQPSPDPAQLGQVRPAQASPPQPQP